MTFLFFDAAGTIIDPHPSVGYHYAAIANGFGEKADPFELELGFRNAFHLARQQVPPGTLPYGRTHEEARAFWRPVVDRSFRLAGLEMPFDPYFDTVYDHFATRACWRVYNDFAEAVALARGAGMRVGLLSNFDPRLRPLLEDLAIAHHFDLMIISCEVGAEKPHASIFEAARGACGNPPPAQCALIGDTPREDILGANNAGWRSCLIERNGRRPDHDGLRATTLTEAVRCFLP